MILLQQEGAPSGTPAPPPVPQQPLATPTPVSPQAPPPAATPPPAPEPVVSPQPQVQVAPLGGEPPISADTPLIFNNPDGSEVTKTVAELIEDSNRLGGLGDPDKLAMMQKAMAGDNAAIQQFLQGYLAEQQAATAEQPAPLHASTLDPETAARLERMESELGRTRGFVAQRERQEREGWVGQALQAPEIAQHVPLASKHPNSVQRIMEHLDVARMVLQQQGIVADTPQHQQAMQKALYGAFMEVERKLKADQDYFSQMGQNPQSAEQNVQQDQPADGVTIPPTPAGSAPLTQNQTPRGSQTTKKSMREKLGAQVRASQMQ